MKYIKKCPICNTNIHYKNKVLYKQSIKRNSKCKPFCNGKPSSKKHKICRRCESDKLKTEFNKKKSNPDGLQRMCKQCQKIDNKKYYNSNYHSQWEQDNKVRRSEQKKIYYKDNKKHILARQHEYQSKNPEKRKQTNKKYSIKNNGENSRRRRAMKLNLNEYFTEKEWKITLAAFNYKCYNCGNKENLCKDHNYPLSKGHPLTLQNCVVLCKRCNSSKLNKYPEKFYSKSKFKKLKIILKSIK